MKQSETVNALKAGGIYFLGIFALGFLLGIIRTLLVIPYTGAVAGVLIEMPFMLTASWFLCRRLIKRYLIVKEYKYLIIVGTSAFSWLMVTEVVFGIYLFNQTWSQYLSNFQTLHGAIGLCMQMVFGAIPVIQNLKLIMVIK